MVKLLRFNLEPEKPIIVALPTVAYACTDDFKHEMEMAAAREQAATGKAASLPRRRRGEMNNTALTGVFDNVEFIGQPARGRRRHRDQLHRLRLEEEGHVRDRPLRPEVVRRVQPREARRARLHRHAGLLAERGHGRRPEPQARLHGARPAAFGQNQADR